MLFHYAFSPNLNCNCNLLFLYYMLISYSRVLYCYIKLYYTVLSCSNSLLYSFLILNFMFDNAFNCSIVVHFITTRGVVFRTNVVLKESAGRQLPRFQIAKLNLLYRFVTGNNKTNLIEKIKFEYFFKKQGRLAYRRVSNTEGYLFVSWMFCLVILRIWEH
jgi:hypothetical protein